MKIIKFSATWCNPCKTLAGMLTGIKEDFKSKNVEYIELDADTNTDKMQQYGVRNLPAIVMVNDADEVVKKHQGLIQKSELLSWA